MPSLRRTPSFSRQRKAPSLPPAPSQKHGTHYQMNGTEDVKLCKVLRGWLKKRHQAKRTLGSQWGARYVWVDDVDAVLCYSKSQASDGVTKSCVRLAEVTSVTAGEGRAELPAHCIVVSCAAETTPDGRPATPCEYVFAAEDKEEAQMWIAQQL